MKILSFALKNKVLMLVALLAVTGVGMLGISAAEILKPSEENGKEVKEKYSAESSTVPSTTEKVPIPKITSSNVKKIFIPLISNYTSLEQITHYAAGVDYSKDYTYILPDSWYEEQGMYPYAVMGVYRFKNIKTVDELVSHYKKYLSANIVDEADLENNGFLFCDDNRLYAVQGAKGTYDYDANSITLVGEQDGGYLISVDSFIAEGTYIHTETYFVKYVDGRFIIDKLMCKSELSDKPTYLTDFDAVSNYY